MLQTLSVSNNYLAEFPNIHFPLLRSMWISLNRIEELQITVFLPHLQQLFAQDNGMKRCGPLNALPSLKVLDVSFNRFASLKRLAYLGTLSRLENVNLAENPIANKRRYRDSVLRMMPWVRELDNVIVSEKEMREGMRQAILRFIALFTQPDLGSFDQLSAYRSSKELHTINECLKLSKGSSAVRFQPEATIDETKVLISELTDHQQG